MPEEPEFPEVFRYLWNWFLDLSRRRGGGFGPAPITWLEFNAWAERTKSDPSPWEAAVIMRLDDVYLKSTSDKSDKPST